MPEILKITIKGCSGYCSYDDAYDDKLVLTPMSISYDYVPLQESELNHIRKWSYKTNRHFFRESFEQVASMIPDILSADDTFLCTDVGMVDFTVTYSDKTRKHIRYWCTGDHFLKCFSIIKKLVPNGEEIPKVLKQHIKNKLDTSRTNLRL